MKSMFLGDYIYDDAILNRPCSSECKQRGRKAGERAGSLVNILFNEVNVNCVVKLRLLSSLSY